MAVTITVSYLGDLHCEATHEPSGGRLVTDAPVDNGGKGDTFSPTDLTATGLGTCLMTIMGLVAKRHDWDLTGTRVRVVKEMTAVPVRRIGAGSRGIRLRVLLERAADTCPVRQSLHPDVKVTMVFEWGGEARG